MAAMPCRKLEDEPVDGVRQTLISLAALSTWLMLQSRPVHRQSPSAHTWSIMPICRILVHVDGDRHF
jgi:hypothetical protein